MGGGLQALFLTGHAGDDARPARAWHRRQALPPYWALRERQLLTRSGSQQSQKEGGAWAQVWVLGESL